MNLIIIYPRLSSASSPTEIMIANDISSILINTDLSSLISSNNIIYTSTQSIDILDTPTHDELTIDIYTSLLLYNSNIFSHKSTTKVVLIKIYYNDKKISALTYDYSGNLLSDKLLNINSSNNIVNMKSFYYFNKQTSENQIIILLLYKDSLAATESTLSLFTYIHNSNGTLTNLESKDLQTFDASNNPVITFLRQIGPWVFYCTKNPDNCFSLLSNQVQEDALLNSINHLFKINTSSSIPEQRTTWYVTDISFYEKQLYGEIIPVIFYYEMNDNDYDNYIVNNNIFKGAYFNLIQDSVDTDNNGTCFLLTKTHPHNVNKNLCVLRCDKNQYHDSSSSTKCLSCGVGQYVKDNSCVNSCSGAPSNTNIMGFCSSSYFFYTEDYHFLGNENISTCLTCSTNTIRYNNSNVCVSCDTYSAVLMINTCEDYCRENYLLNTSDNYICNEGSCSASLVLEEGKCDSSCIIRGNIADIGNNICKKCSGTNYEYNNSSCIDDTACLSYTNHHLAKNPDNNNALFCLDCGSQVFEDNKCKSNCEIAGNYLNPSTNECEICNDNKFLLSDGITCSSSCSSDSTPNVASLINNETSGNYCVVCNKYIQNNQCVDDCSVPGYFKNTTTKTCKSCSSGLYYDYTVSICNDCNISKDYLINYTDPLTFSNYCYPCQKGLYVEDNSCVLSCNSSNYISSSGKKCVSDCEPGEITGTDADGNKICEPPLCPNYYNTVTATCSVDCSGYVIYINECFNSCPANTFYDSTTNNCLDSCSIYYYNNQCVSSCSSGLYLLTDSCYDSCPTGYYSDNVGFTCVADCSTISMYTLENTKECVSTCTGTYYLYDDNNCVDSCISGKYIENSTCVTACSSSHVIYNNQCISECPVNMFVYNNQCVGECPNNTYYYNKQCLVACPNNTYLSDNYCVLTCDEGKYYYNNICLDVCPYLYYQNTCVNSCPDQYIASKNDLICVLDTSSNDISNTTSIISDISSSNTTCPSETIYSITQNKCVFCYETTNTPYILDGKCVSNCSSIYIIKIDSVNSEKKTCILNKYTEKICPGYCNSQGDCSLTVDNDGQCSCYPNYYGAQCNLTSSDIDSIENERDQLYSQIIDSINTSQSISDMIDEIKSLTNIIKEAPELFTNEILDTLVSLSTSIIGQVNNNKTELTKDILDLVDSTFSIKLVSNMNKDNSNSTISASELIDLITALSSNLYDGDISVSPELSNNLNNTESSIFYSGDTFSIQVSDNSEADLTEARENGLSIVDYSNCIEYLKSIGAISSNDTSYYVVNTNIDYGLTDDYQNSKALSSGYSVTSLLLDEDFTDIDTSQCNSIIVKTSVNAEATGFSGYISVLDSYGVDIYNKSSEFFNDICFSYTSDNNTDITIDKRRDIFNLTAMCSENCEYEGLDEHGYSICDCDVAPTNTAQFFEESIYENLLDNNIALIKCYRQAFDSDTLLQNLGFWVITVGTVLILIIFLIVKYNCTYWDINRNLDEVLHNDCEYGIKIPGNDDINNNDRPAFSGKSIKTGLKKNSNIIDSDSNRNAEKSNNYNYSKSILRKINTNNKSSSNYIYDLNTLHCNDNVNTQSTYIYNINKINNDINCYTNYTNNSITIANSSPVILKRNKLLNDKESLLKNSSKNKKNELEVVSSHSSSISHTIIDNKEHKNPKISNIDDNMNHVNTSISTKDKLAINQLKNISFNENKARDGIFEFYSDNTNSNNQEINVKPGLMNNNLGFNDNHNPFILDNNPNSKDKEGNEEKKIEEDSQFQTPEYKEKMTNGKKRNIILEENNSKWEFYLNDKDKNKNTNNISNNSNNSIIQIHAPNVVGNMSESDNDKEDTNKNYQKNNKLKQITHVLSLFDKDSCNVEDNVIINNNDGDDPRKNDSRQIENDICKIQVNKENVESNQESGNIINSYNSNHKSDNNVKEINTNKRNDDNPDNNNFRTSSIKSSTDKITNNYIISDDLKIAKLKSYESKYSFYNRSTNKSLNKYTESKENNETNKYHNINNKNDLNTIYNKTLRTEHCLMNLDNEIINLNDKINRKKNTYNIQYNNNSDNRYQATPLYTNNNTNSNQYNTIDSNNNMIIKNNKLISNDQDTQDTQDTHETKFKKYLFSLKYSNINSNKDFRNLPYEVQIKIDDRSVWSFFWENLKTEHIVLNLFFLKSILSPLWIRLVNTAFQYSIDLALNALFFSSSIINSQAEQKTEEGTEAIGFWYIITNEFWKSFWPIVISVIIVSIINLIIKIPKAHEIEMNYAMKTKNKDVIKSG